MTDDLWNEASDGHDAMAREASLALADAELEAVMPFLLASRTAQEYAHRSALAQESISSIAARCGIDEDELFATAQRRYDLYRQALAEGQDPLDEVMRSVHTYGTGPEEGYEHEEGPDFSHGYSEVPQGAPGGPDPRVTQVRPPSARPVQEATGARRTADSSPQSAMTPSYAPMPADTGTGAGSVDMGMPSASMQGMSPSLPAGVPGQTSAAPVPSSAALPPAAPSSAAPVGQVTSSRDPVRRRVMAVTAAVAASNPQLPEAECGRIARLVVGRYLRQADLDSSVMNDDPGSGGGGSGGSPGGSGGGAVQHMLEGQGLRSMIPGAGGGAGAGAAAGGLEDAAMLAAL
jgi:hypothetical protein